MAVRIQATSIVHGWKGSPLRRIPVVDQNLTPPPAAPEVKKPIEHIRENIDWSIPYETYNYIMNMDGTVHLDPAE